MFDPRTGKFTNKARERIQHSKKSEDTLVKLAGDRVGQDKARLSSDINLMRSRINSSLRDISTYNSNIGDYVTVLKSLPDNLMVQTKVKETILKMRTEYGHHIAMIDVGLKAIAVTTTDLYLYKGTPIKDGTIQKKTHIGRFLIVVPTERDYRGKPVEIHNLSYRVRSDITSSSQYHHPFINSGGVCMGEAERGIIKAWKNGDYVSVIVQAIDLIFAPAQDNPYISWSTYLEQRKKINDALQQGEKYWKSDVYPCVITKPIEIPKPSSEMMPHTMSVEGRYINVPEFSSPEELGSLLAMIDDHISRERRNAYEHSTIIWNLELIKRAYLESTFYTRDNERALQGIINRCLRYYSEDVGGTLEMSTIPLEFNHDLFRSIYQYYSRTRITNNERYWSLGEIESSRGQFEALIRGRSTSQGTFTTATAASRAYDMEQLMREQLRSTSVGTEA